MDTVYTYIHQSSIVTRLIVYKKWIQDVATGAAVKYAFYLESEYGLGALSSTRETLP